MYLNKDNAGKHITRNGTQEMSTEDLVENLN